MTVSTSAAFLDLLRESNVLSPESLKRAENLVGDAADTKAAARQLVKAELLTKWQASQLLMGSPLLSLGKYVLLDRLPWGSTHAVFLATHPMMDRKVALNVLDRKRSSRSDSVSGFLSDARSIASLDHRNLIHVFDVDEAEGRYFLVMEYVDGRNLYDVVKTDGPLALDAAADIMRQVAEGLQSAHSNKLVHGGLRPTNLILDRHGAVKIIDLGMAKFDDPTQQPDGQEDDSKILSVADYLSPEQAAGKLPTPAADIYSLGCISYWLLSGTSPFGKGNYTQRLQRHQHDAPPDVRGLRKNVPEALAKIVQKMMAKSSDDRYAAAKDISAELQAWWGEYSAQLEAAKPKPKPVPAARPAAGSGAHPVARNGAKPAAVAPVPTRPSQPAKAADSAPIIINTKQRTKSAPKSVSKPAPVATTPAAVVSPSPAVVMDVPQPAPHAASQSRGKMPWLLIFGAVGGALLLAGVASGVTAYFFMNREKPSEVAQVAGDNTTGDKTPKTNDPSAESGESGSGSENNGAAAGGENPTDKPDDKPELPAPGEGDPEGNDNPPPENPVGGEPGNENPDGGATAEPPKIPDPPLPQPDPQPPKENPPKEKPPKEKPPKEANPFKDLAPAVALPALPGGEQPSEAILAKMSIPADTAVYIDLLGGDKVAPDEKDRFTLDRARKGLADREWELKLESPPDGPAVVANMELTDDGLSFKWTDEAAKLEATPYLGNCLLNLRTSDHESFMAMRQPQEATALAVRLDRPVLREKYNITNPPRGDSVFVEFTGVGGFEKYEVLPKQKLVVTERDSTGVRFGEGEQQVLAAKIDSAMQKDLQLTLTPYVKAGDWVPFNQRQLRAAAVTLDSQIRQLEAAIKAADQIKNADQKKKAKDQFEGQRKTAEGQFTELQKLGKQLEEVAAKNIYIKFRVFYDTGTNTVTLISGETAPEAPAAIGGDKGGQE